MAKTTQVSLLSFLPLVFLTIPIGKVLAQITPDSTLGQENSVVTPVDELNEHIEGGAARGGNLFHSFSEFNVGEGRGVDFVNPAGIDNILTRVTGNNISNIFGRLGVLGKANLFLINPNGIVFGANARLDVAGSFLATTADGMRFGDNGIFSASNPETSNLLTIQPSALFFNQLAAGKIVNRSQTIGLNGETNPVGLSVSAGKTLALVGGEVSLELGNLTAPGGRIEIGSVAGGEEVSLSRKGDDSWVLGYEEVSAFQDIEFTGAGVDVSGNGGGEVQIQGRNLEMNRGSYLFANNTGKKTGGEVLVKTTEDLILSGESQLTANVLSTGSGNNIVIETNNLKLQDDSVISAITFGQGDGGNLDVTANQSIELVGNSPKGLFGSRLFAESGLIASVHMEAKGSGGNLTISTENLLVRDGTQVGSSTFGEGDGGELFVTAQSIELVGNGNDISFPSSLNTAVGEIDSKATGDGGNLTIDTDELIVRDGAAAFSGTFGAGNAGNLEIYAQSIELVDATDNFPIRSGLYTSIGIATLDIVLDATGDGGNLTVNTNKLIVSGGATVFTNTAAQGEGGDLTINAKSIEVTGIFISPEGRIIPSNLSTGVDLELAFNPELNSRAEGTGGELFINTENLIVRDRAVVSTGTLGKGKAGDLTIANAENIIVSNGASISTSTAGKGDAGNLNINARSLEIIGISPDGQFPSSLLTGVGTNLDVENRKALNSQATGDGGQLIIDTKSLILDDGARIIASSFGEGETGNIDITATDLLLLQQGSQISTTAGTVSVENNGGNININTDFLVAFPNENSDITADSSFARGGNITINAVGIFGIEAREERTQQSDITASSQADRNLNGQINLNSLEIEPTRQLFFLPTQPLNAQVAQTCTPGTKEARSELIFIGKGGIAPNNLEALQFNPTLPDWQELPAPLDNSSQSQLSIPETTQPTPQIVEAQGWIRDENGEVILVANTSSSVTLHDSWENRVDCHAN